MAAHASYTLIIYNLVSLKSQFRFITAEKFQGVIKELSNYDIQFNSDNDHLPDPIQLASKLKCDQTKLKKILKDLHNKIIEALNEHPLIIKDVVHILHVSPFIEPEEKNKDWVQK
jgi:predicted transcriptional regulator